MRFHSTGLHLYKEVKEGRGFSNSNFLPRPNKPCDYLLWQQKENSNYKDFEPEIELFALFTWQ